VIPSKESWRRLTEKERTLRAMFWKKKIEWRDKSGESRVYIRTTGVTRRKITVRWDIRETIKRSSFALFKIESKRPSFIHLGISRPR